MNHDVMPVANRSTWRAPAIALTAASSVAMSSCERTPATVAAALRVTLATMSSALSVDVDAAVQRRAAERQFVRQRELELAQAGEAEVAAGAHDRRHRTACAAGQQVEAFGQHAVGVLEHQVEDRAPRRRRLVADLRHLAQQAVAAHRCA